MLVSFNDETVENDTVELVRAAEQLPLGSLIGTGIGITNPHYFGMIVEQANGAGAFQKLWVCGRGGERT
jgi:thiazole synthase ThiGH ThiG subunit